MIDYISDTVNQAAYSLFSAISFVSFEFVHGNQNPSVFLVNFGGSFNKKFPYDPAYIKIASSFADLPINFPSAFIAYLLLEYNSFEDAKTDFFLINP